jgi:hypothetical protein
MKKAAGPNGPTAKKKDPPAQCRKADEIYLKLQKNAPFPTRQWLYVFLPIAKIPLLNIEKSDFDFLVLDSKVENFLISN